MSVPTSGYMLLQGHDLCQLSRSNDAAHNCWNRLLHSLCRKWKLLSPP